jgi:hypothetical protein
MSKIDSAIQAALQNLCVSCPNIYDSYATAFLNQADILESIYNRTATVEHFRYGRKTFVNEFFIQKDERWLIITVGEDENKNFKFQNGITIVDRDCNGGVFYRKDGAELFDILQEFVMLWKR